MTSVEAANSTEIGRVIREGWIEGVRRYYDGDPPEAFVRSWEDLPEWERQSAAAIYRQIQFFIRSTHGEVRQLSRTQKGQFVGLCWIGQIYARVEDKTGSHLEEWDEMPTWHQQTDSDIFDKVLEHVVSVPEHVAESAARP